MKMIHGIEIPDDLFQRAPRIWKSLGNGQNVKIVDLDWIKENLPEPEPEIIETKEVVIDGEMLKASLPSLTDVIIKDILDKYYPDMTMHRLKNASRKDKFRLIRNHIYYELYQRNPAISFTEIANIFNRNDHTTVYKAIKRWLIDGPKQGFSVDPIKKKIKFTKEDKMVKAFFAYEQGLRGPAPVIFYDYIPPRNGKPIPLLRQWEIPEGTNNEEFFSSDGSPIIGALLRAYPYEQKVS